MEAQIHQRNYEEPLLPYQAWSEQIRDWLDLLDFLIEWMIQEKKSKVTKQEAFHLKGLVITYEEIKSILAGERDIFLSDALDAETLHTFRSARRHILHREKESKKTGVFLPLSYLADCFHLTEFERFCVLLALAVEVDRKYEKFYAFIQDDATAKMPTMGLALALYSVFGELEEVDETALLIGSKLYRFFMHEPSKEEINRSRLSRPLRLNEKMYRFLTGHLLLQDKSEKYYSVRLPGELPPILFGQALQEGMRQCVDTLFGISERKKTIFFLEGPAGAGKHFQLQHLANYLDIPLVMLDVGGIKDNSLNYESMLHAVIRETILQRAALCLENFEQLLVEDEKEQAPLNLSAFFKLLAEHVDFLFVLSQKEWNTAALSLPFEVLEFALEYPNHSQRHLIWKKMSEGMVLEAGINLAAISNKFIFTPGKIRKVLTEARFESDLAGITAIEEQRLYRISSRQAAHRLEKKATRIRPTFSWDDMVIPEDQKKVLRYACDQIKYRHIVYDTWGFQQKLPYGKGLSLLFYGPPGTGKTMGAQVIANELKLELFRVDLSQIISKYIGETEKNLREIFDEAAKTSAILFFDEADSLFGKRTEVKDAHDKYANTEVSYLLQKMEEYEGITILATNLMNNFDEAYRRRLKFIVNFPMPGVEMRKEMWQKVFPRELPLSPDVDFDFLAERFELSGSHIKNIAVTASFLAAGDADTSVKMKHLLISLKNEMTKVGKIMVRQDMGGYGYMLDEESKRK